MVWGWGAPQGPIRPPRSARRQDDPRSYFDIQDRRVVSETVAKSAAWYENQSWTLSRRAWFGIRAHHKVPFVRRDQLVANVDGGVEVALLALALALRVHHVHRRHLLGRKILGYLEKGIQTPMAQGRSAKIISMIKWIRTRRLSIENSLLEVALLALPLALRVHHVHRRHLQWRFLISKVPCGAAFL